MDILLVGGANNLMNAMIHKLNKEGHRVYILTGRREKTGSYSKVFEKYYFPYESDCLKEIFESVNPDVIVFMGAYDPNFDWSDARRESVHYSASLLNMLMAFSALKHSRFIYLSSEEVYGQNYDFDITEEEPTSGKGFRAMTLAQGEELCESYRTGMGLDTVVLRLDHLYDIPKKKADVSHICGRMCIEALGSGKINANGSCHFSLLYLDDAVEFIYRILRSDIHKKNIYHLSSGVVTDEYQLAQLIQKNIGNCVVILNNKVNDTYRVVLSHQAFEEEFGLQIHHQTADVIRQMAGYMKRHSGAFVEQRNKFKGLIERIFFSGSKSVIGMFIPFVENLICFIPFFMLNNRAVGSEYFANLDFYLLYVLLFAIVYGQQQATFSAILAVAGYCFRQMYHRSGLDVFLDYNTYVWIAQLFILGLIVGYMRDRLKIIKGEDEKEIDYLSGQLDDIQDINTSNVRMKNVLEAQIVNQNDSFGKIYEITSSLDKYAPEEVLFYAAEVLSRLIGSKDVAIYTVASHSYARLFSATSEKARKLGNSINYTQLNEMYQPLKEKRVYINKNMDETYPLMANAIYSEDQMQLILMVWSIPWERMTLGQANMLVVIGYLIQNAVVRANRYLEALEQQRYVEGTTVLEQEAFSSLVKAYMTARGNGLTECTILAINTGKKGLEKAQGVLSQKLRQTDYLGRLKDGNLYALLSNTNRKDANYVIKRFEEAGFKSRIQEDLKI